MPVSPETYAERYTSPLPPLLQEVLDFTLQHHPQHHMVSGHVQGQFLRMISHMLQPKYVLEIGTFTGFSALCLAEGLQPDGALYTMELREQDAATARSFLNRSPWQQHIHICIGEAARIIPDLTFPWDLVFIDADKAGYSHYLDLVLPQVRPGGIILADNVLFHGDVLQDEIKGKNAKAIAAFNEKVRATPGIDHTLLTIRDGLMMIRKQD
ncbi:MAG TPA: O-methyltransferase [Phnomibacter sp.]|nr:O-methyltransferase [Phnomibacter sp.]